MLYTYNRLSGNTNVSKPSLALAALVIGILALLLSSYLVYDRYDGPLLEKDTLRKENVEAKAMFIVKDLKSKIEEWKEEHENNTKTDKDIIQDVMYKPQSDNIVSQLDANGVKTPALKINDLESINRTQINVNHPLRISTLLEREDFRGISMPNTLFIDTLKEYTLKAGIDIEGTLFRDGNIYTDIVNEKTIGAGVTIDGVLIKDGLVDGVDISTLSPTSISTDLIPTTDSTYDLGSPNHYWSNAYIDNLLVSGTITSVNQLEVDDPILKLNNGATDDTNDIGFYGQHNINLYSGLVRDATDNYWTFFESITTEPTTNASIGTSYGHMRVGHIAAGQDLTYDIGASGTRWANIYADALDAINITGTLQTAAQGNITSLGTLTALTVDNWSMDGSNMTYSGSTGNNLITVPDNLASALSITNGTQEYLRIVSTTSSETVKLMQDTTVFGSIEIDDLIPDENGMYNGVFLSRAVANFIGMDIGFNANVHKFNYRFSAPTALDIVFATHDGNPTVHSDFNVQMTIDGANGYVGMGVEDPLTRLHVEDTSTQLRLDYNSNYRAAFTVNSSGNLTIDPTGGYVTFNSNILVSADSIRDIGASGTRWANIYADALDAINITGTLQTAAQGNITSLGTLTALTVDNWSVDGSNMTYSGSTGNNLITVPDNLASALSITDGTQNYLQIVSTTSNDQVNLLQNTQITGHLTTATDSTYDIGASGTRWANIYADALDATNITGTLQTAAQGNITSLGTLTALTVDNWSVDGSNMTYSGTTGNNLITVPDNLASALSITDGTQEYLRIVSTTSSDQINLLQNTEITGNVTTATGSTYNLGAYGTAWLNLYADTVNTDSIILSNSLAYLGTSGTNFLQFPNNYAQALIIRNFLGDSFMEFKSTSYSEQIFMNQDTEITGHLTTGTDSTYNIGASGTRWATIYGDTLNAPTITDGTATLTSGGLTGITTLTVDNVNINGNTVNATSGNLILASTSGLVEISDDVSIGTTSNNATLQVRDTTEQLRLDYDASNYVSFTVDSSGDLNIAPTGNMGIGTIPSYKLDVNDSSTAEIIGAFTGASTNGWQFLRLTNTDNEIVDFGMNNNGGAQIYNRTTGVPSLTVTSDNGNDLLIDSSGDTGIGGDLYPISDNSNDCGTSSNRWDDVYATNSTIQTSDKNQKDLINTSDLGLSFINQLRPVSYKWKDYTTTDKNQKTTNHTFSRIHYGMIAQEVKAVLDTLEKKEIEFAGWCSNTMDDGTKQQGLRYNEFIAPLIKAVQELSAENESLKARVTALEPSTGT